ncbi:MAG TPA: thymidylate synthase [Candidatus Pacearchaeota archaeon]|nr:thymidylate synthase [Candidatus Pacearchaeota archaeon]
MNWPKYYSNQLIINKNTNASIAVVTGWTKKEDVYNSLSPESKEKVCIIGQLYSKEGINYIIRNLFLNPNINYLIITGKDLSQSIKEFKSFLEKEEKDFIHQEISKEKISEFINYFNKHSLAVEISEIDSAIKKIDLSLLPQKWTQEPLDFEDHLAKETNTFPSEKVGFRLEGKKVSEVWLKVLDRIFKFGYEKMSSYSEKQKELINVITVINDDDPDNPSLPPYLYFNKNDLINYYPQIMTDHVFEGVEYTYGSRLRNHNGINQIKCIIEELKKENYSRRAIAFTWNVEKDCNNVKPPCLDLVQALIQNNTLYVSAYFRSNDMFKAWPQNAYGLLKIQKEIAEALNLKIGKLIITSCSAHIYERDYLDAQKIIEKYKSKLECEIDPRGNFVIEVNNKEIFVKHINANGDFLQEFKGKNAQEIRDQISTFITDVAHAIYLGTELHKAELALKNNSKYIQDQD